MRHNRGFNHLGRKANHRKAMLSNMAASLILHKRITTTVAKAKALRQYVEPLINKSKEDSTGNRRLVFSYLQNKFAVSELFREVSPKIATRPGGFTRILKTGNRLGDNADMCIIELVDYNDSMLANQKEAAGKAKRSRRGGAKKTEATAETTTKSKVAEPKAETVETAVVEDAVVVEDTVASAPEVSVETDEKNDQETEEKQ